MKKLKQESKDEVSFNICTDLVTEILSRLNVKALSRFKCVSRSWCDLISDPLFVDIHRQQSMKRVKFLDTSFLHRWCTTTVRFHSITGEQNEQLFSFTLQQKEAKLGVPCYPHDVCPVSCDLVCLHKGNEIYICNPSTHELRVLPKPSVLAYGFLGFGYSSRSGEYKVVNMFPPRRAASKAMGCEVFTISNRAKISSSSWKPVECPRGVHSKPASANGRIYWLINHRAPLCRLKTEELILSFDIASDTFRVLHQPPSWPLGRYKDKLAFLVVNGSLCITNKRWMKKNRVLDIWMLEENCLWTKMYSIDLFAHIRKYDPVLHPDCMIGSEILFESDRSTQFRQWEYIKKYSYSIACDTMREMDLTDGWHNYGTFWESLFKLQ